MHDWNKLLDGFQQRVLATQSRVAFGTDWLYEVPLRRELYLDTGVFYLDNTLNAAAASWQLTLTTPTGAILHRVYEHFLVAGDFTTQTKNWAPPLYVDEGMWVRMINTATLANSRFMLHGWERAKA